MNLHQLLIAGNVKSRHYLGLHEYTSGDMNKAIKHFTIAAGFGHPFSLKFIQISFMAGAATRGDYEEALRAYQQYIEVVKSDQRDEAAAFHDDYKYLIEDDPRVHRIISLHPASLS
jgi:hypothetical protein